MIHYAVHTSVLEYAEHRGLLVCIISDPYIEPGVLSRPICAVITGYVVMHVCLAVQLYAEGCWPLLEVFMANDAVLKPASLLYRC